MPVLEDKELFRRVKQGELAPVCLLYGEEAYFTASAAAQIEKKAAADGFEEFNLHRFDGEKAGLSEIEEACDALPVMADRKCVSVKNLNADKLSKEDFDRLLKLVCAPWSGTVLLLWVTEPVVDLKKSSRWKKLVDTVGKSGIVCCFSMKDRTTLCRALCERAEKAGVLMDMRTAGALVDCCSRNYGVLQNEMDKLIFYVGDKGEITERTVEECCVRSVDSSAFDLAKSILSRDFDRAYRLLDELFYLRQEAVMILSALAMAFSDLYRAKCSLSAGKSPDAVVAEFRYPKNRLFAVKNAFRDVRSYSAEHIRASIDALYQADRKLKSSRLEDRLVLEQMLGEMRMVSVDNENRR